MPHFFLLSIISLDRYIHDIFTFKKDLSTYLFEKNGDGVRDRLTDIQTDGRKIYLLVHS